MTIRIVLADDHDLFRSGFRAAIETQSDLECVADVGDGLAAIEAVARQAPDVAVLDIRMPLMDGLEAAETILRGSTSTKIILLTTHDDDAYLYRGLQAGVSGFCLKGMRTEELLAAIRVAARGDALIDPTVVRRLAHRLAEGIAPARPPLSMTGLDALTLREQEILLHVGRGLSNLEIAAVCFISEQTVKTHVSHILTKLNLRDRVQAVVFVHERRLLR